MAVLLLQTLLKTVTFCIIPRGKNPRFLRSRVKNRVILKNRRKKKEPLKTA